MKVGALTAHAHQPHFYGFTWSPIGVATEYVKPSRVIRDYQITEQPALVRPRNDYHRRQNLRSGFDERRRGGFAGIFCRTKLNGLIIKLCATSDITIGLTA